MTENGFLKSRKSTPASLSGQNFWKPLSLLNILGRPFPEWCAKVAKIATLFAIGRYPFGGFGPVLVLQTRGVSEFFAIRGSPRARRRCNRANRPKFFGALSNL